MLPSVAKKLYMKAVNAYIDKIDPTHKRSRRLYEGEFHIPLHNFSGPGTRIDLKEVRDFPPYNEVDACSKTHDLDYVDIKDRKTKGIITKEQASKEIMDADRKAIECYDKHPSDWGYSAAKAGIRGKLGIESLYSFLKGKPSTFYGSGITYKLDNSSKLIVDTVDSVIKTKDLMRTASFEIKNALRKISYNPSNIDPFGSWIYKSQLYPGDIDLVETEEITGTREEAIKKFVKITKTIIRNIMKSDNYFIGDIKAGFDRRFMIDIGIILYRSIEDGGNKIEGFHKGKVDKEIEELHSKELITEDEANEFIELSDMVKLKTSKWEELYEKLREKWLLRWSPEEILKGYKHLPKGVKYSLSSAIQDPTLTKIDMWTDKGMNGRFIEFSNVLTYIRIDKQTGEREVINYENDIINLAENLKKEVAKYAFSEVFYKPTKMIKRMWSIARLYIKRGKHIDEESYIKDIKILTQILQSDIGRLSQIISDLDVLKLITASESENNIKDEDIPYDSIFNELSNIIYRMQNLYEIGEDEENYLDEAIEGIEYTIEELTKRKDINNSIIEIKKFLNDVLQKFTKSLLEKVGYYPPPKRFLQ